VTPSADGRAAPLPDFIIIGAAKSGTTSLFMWLGDQPEVFRPPIKEPDFFSKDRVWRRGRQWYANIFSGAPAGALRGEASTSYTELGFCSIAAERMAEVVPNARLVYLLRHPIERLSSHYRHELQKGRERRPLAEAVAAPGNEYVGSSMYFSCLAPYTTLFDRDQICVVRFEDVLVEPAPGWSSVLAHLGLPDRSAPGTVWNRTDDKPAYTRSMLKLYELGVLRGVKFLPGPVRRAGKALLTRNETERGREEPGRSPTPVPPGIEQQIWADVERLEEWLGEGELWERPRSVPFGG
jgi:hypothetical protein